MVSPLLSALDENISAPPPLPIKMESASVYIFNFERNNGQLNNAPYKVIDLFFFASFLALFILLFLIAIAIVILLLLLRKAIRFNSVYVAMSPF